MLLKGKVTDSRSGLGIPALVFKSDSSGKNLGVGGVANIDGDYTIDNVNVGDYVTASMLGLKPLTKKIANTGALNFSLSESAASLLNTFEIVADKPTTTKPPIDKANWFKRNQKLVVIASVSLIALIMGVIIIKSTRK